MKPNLHFDHFNINVSDLQRSLDFYNKALGLVKIGEIIAPDNSFIINYLGLPGQSADSFRLELTWLRDHTQPYELGENESHLAMRASGDYEQLRQYHREMGVICFENPAMGIYFIHDPDDYWIEILPPRK
ncbi:MAG: lactoylglutathione lyase [Bacteroides sp.]|nr:lactoylglutathione lyase [Bacteroides sp.]